MSAPTPTLGGQRLPVLLFFGGMLALLLGERIIGGEGTARYVLDGLGLLLTAGFFALSARALAAASASQKGAHRLVLLFGMLCVGAVVLYAGTTDAAVDALGFSDEESEARYETLLGTLWPMLWLAGTLPLLTLDRLLAANPISVSPGLARGAAMRGLSLAFALSLLFPLNYIATERNERFDFGYFKTALPGTSTQNMVGALEEPIAVYLFFPSTSEVTEELKSYFTVLDELGGDQFVVEYVDHALEPDLAKELRIRSNGTIALVRGEGEEQQVDRIKVGEDLDAARRKLKRLDEDFNKALLKMARDKRVIYFTAGHGELNWDAENDVLHKTSNLRKLLRALNYSVKELSLAEGLGSEVPEDASAVVVLGAESDFLEEELETLNAYRAQGGSLLLGIEPGGPALEALTSPLGVTADTGVQLVHDSKFALITRRKVDRANLVTNEYSTHPSVTELSRNNERMVFIAPGASLLTERAGGGKTTTTIRGMDGTWADKNRDFEFNAETEKRDNHALAVAANGSIEDSSRTWDDSRTEYRAIVMGDATWAADAVLPLDANRANFQYVIDAMAWLTHDESTGGTIESEEDIKIQHAKAEQGWIFYATSFLIPLALFGLGLGRISLRRRRGNA